MNREQKLNNNDVVKQFIKDAHSDDLDAALEAMQKATKRIARFEKTNTDFIVQRVKSEFPTTSKHKLLVESGKLGEKLELVKTE